MKLEYIENTVDIIILLAFDYYLSEIIKNTSVCKICIYNVDILL